MHARFLDHITHARRQSTATVRLRDVYLRQLEQVVDLTAATTTDLIAWVNNPDWSPCTTNAAIATARAFYRWAHETGLIDTNPAAPLRRVSIPPKRPRVATAEHIDTGLATGNPTMQAIILLGAECGLRVHEIAKLHTDDRRGEWLDIIGKGGQQRTVHTSPELARLLDQLAPEPGWYFPSPRGGHIVPATIRNWMRRHVGTNPHSLRHRAGTTVYQRTGNNLRLTQVFLGHRDPGTTAIYVHINDDDLRAASAAARIAA
ncbi:tyrosine-type recombinase/integrase [Microbacterium sp.]|uniref:tyrosine-type recombinase/integrase n=1 Tax=Microbacterium sp. TaxID=51671 RepID=UPI0039E372DE